MLEKKLSDHAKFQNRLGFRFFNQTIGFNINDLYDFLVMSLVRLNLDN